MPVWVKVCGLTRLQDVEAAVAAGADAVGLVMAPESPRFVSPDQARKLASYARDLAPGVAVVGVFTQTDAGLLLSTARAAGVDLVQLHGQQSGRTRWSLERAGFPCIRALWPSEQAPQAPATEDFALLEGQEPAGWEPDSCGPPRAFLLDRRSGQRQGGTGLSHPVTWAAWWVRRLSVRAPVVLAGGLSPDNVASYLDHARPWGVDASSALEVPGCPGVKDPGRIRAFVQAVREWEKEHGT